MMEQRREAVGRVWLMLVHKHHAAACEEDEPRRVQLFNLLEQFEAEFPDEVSAERALWTPE